MKLEITAKKENKLLKRTEIEFSIDHRSEATPSRIGMRESIAGKLGCDAELIVISKFKTTYGEGRSNGVAHQYKNAKDLKSIEPKYLLKRYEPREKKKKEEPVKEAEEAPAEGAEEAKSEESEAPAEQDSGSSKLAEGEPAPEEKDQENKEEEASE